MPSPSMNGMIGRSGTCNLVPAMVIFWPVVGGTGLALVGVVMGNARFPWEVKKRAQMLTQATRDPGAPAVRTRCWRFAGGLRHTRQAMSKLSVDLPGKLRVRGRRHVNLTDAAAARTYGWDEARAEAQTARLADELEALQYKL